MKILIATGIYPPDIGGPALYAKNLKDEFAAAGHEVRVATYTWERKLPFGARNLAYLVCILPKALWADKILVLDTFSAAVPAATAAVMFGKPYVLRVGGDFLWEQYVERARTMVPLDEFYADGFASKLSRKEKLVLAFTRFVLHHAATTVFTTEWQCRIWKSAYGLDVSKTQVVENFIGDRAEADQPEKKTFLFAGRDIFLKNADMLIRAFATAREVHHDIELERVQAPHDELMKLIRKCYCVVIPSLSEVSPNLALDALRYGKPIILTNRTGYGDMLAGHATFVDPFDESDLAEKISMLAEPGGYDEAVRRADSFSLRRPWRDVAMDFLRIIQST